MKLSICIVNWNGAGVFEQCLKSLQKECKRSRINNYEIIIVDNNSTTLNRKSLNKFKNLHLYINKKFTFSRATNQSIQYSKGKYILILNNDIILQPNFFNFIFKKIDSYDAIAPKLILPNGNIQKSMSYIPTIKEVFLSIFGVGTIFQNFDLWPNDNTNYLISHPISPRNQPAFSALLIKRTTWKKVGKLDLNLPLLWNDTDWFFRFHQKKLKCFYCQEAVALHYHGFSVNKNRFNKIFQSTKSMEYFLKKSYHPNFFQKIIIKIVAIITLVIRLLREYIVVISTNKGLVFSA